MAPQPAPRTTAPPQARPAIRRGPLPARGRALPPSIPEPPVWGLVRGPALLTLAATLLRLLGERNGWSPTWFSTLPGGGLSPVGITWLVPLVGLYLGWRLQRLGFPPPSRGRALAWPACAVVAFPTLAWLFDRLVPTTWTQAVVVWGIAALAAAVASAAAWPVLGRRLAVYALAARLPVVAVMALAIHRNWHTHYDAPPPSFPAMPALQRWVFTGLVPQGTIWIGFTIAVGALFAGLGLLAASRRPR